MFIWNERVNIALDSFDSLRTAILIRNVNTLEFTLFENDTHKFIPGEYEYQKAIIQLILETVSTNMTVPQVTDWVFNVDIPDTVDRGSATLTANAPLTIAFTRKFYHVPEVNVTVKSGNNISAFPQITDITEINFTVVSTDSCTISWTAVGY